MNSIRPLIILATICSSVLVVAFLQERAAIAAEAPIINGERYIVVIIPSYNNSKWYNLNLGYLFAQKYSNYRVIYIDDCSTDGTGQLVQNFIKKYGQEHRFTLIKNTERHGALYNLYYAIHSCPDRAIVVTLDGDDWFKGTDVLQTINAAYADPHVWLTYGQYEEFPRGSLGICHPMPETVIAAHNYRSINPWFTSHLRTFYAGLFKSIKQEDLMHEGDFFSVTWDQAFMFPMLEMAHGRIKFIDKILYVYNQANPLNDFKVKLRNQLLCERIIRAKKPYAPLNEIQAQTFCVAA